MIDSDNTDFHQLLDPTSKWNRLASASIIYAMYLTDPTISPNSSRRKIPDSEVDMHALFKKVGEDCGALAGSGADFGYTCVWVGRMQLRSLEEG